jgi:hypothetical protein
MRPRSPLTSRFSDQASLQEDAEEKCQEDDHQWPANELGQCELPADEQGQDDAQCDDEVC